MAKLTYTRHDLEVLIDRLEMRSVSVVLFDMPRLAADLRVSARLLRWMMDQGMPVTSIEIENGNGL